ncbi:MAG: lysylphosphatidylglycerol synthase transmembrane domain-containing protein [bacterium]
MRRGRPSRRLLRPIALGAAAVAVLAGVAWFVGWGATLDAVAEAGWLAFVVGAALTPVWLLCYAAAWQALSRGLGQRIPLRTLFEGTVVGQAGSMVTPSAYLGGEPLKVLYVGRAAGGRYRQVAGSVVLGKYLEALSFIGLFAFGAVVAAVSYREVLFSGPHALAGPAVLLAAGVLVALAGGVWTSLHRRWRPLTAVVRALARPGPFRGALERVAERSRVMEAEVSRAFREEGGAARRGLLFYALGHVTMLVKPGIFFWLGSGAGVGLAQLCLIFVATQVLLGAQLTPGGLGMFDGGLLGFCALIGVAPGQCAAYLLCVRLTDALMVGGGAWLAARVGLELLGGKAGTASPKPAIEPGPGVA